ncbi:nucleotide exchange factor GrpE [Gryllotalpicola ginsengisoli]|uniref:nucleotide exchange factor GrpE n=1 Tax=Gryllotalpicola ginsengisoli TaxID=444608 RepID=UPI0003B4C956|nr:nucleotide exchange factor GrpE [Gryllotalpicola ginsengisoli]
MTDENSDKHEEREEPIVRDRRRIDPQTGQVRRPESADGAEADASAPEGQAAEASDAPESAPEAAPDATAEGESGQDGEELFVEDILNAAEAETSEPSDEHLADLKRVTAEYANYRRRTESERVLERERAVRDTVKVLLPVLDDLDRAQKHGDLEGEGAFPTIAAKLRGAVEKLGLKPFGEVGEVFDPQKHEAIYQQPTPGATETTVLDVVEVGYTLGSTLVRVAKVVVATPAD